MKTFILTGPHKGKTMVVASWAFVDGRLQLPDQDADAASRILCRYHACQILETDDMIVSIWGPKDDKEWRQRAQTIARERWPGRVLIVSHPSQWEPMTPETVATLDGVILTEGCEQVLEGMRSCGVRDKDIFQIPLDPTIPDPNRAASETQQHSRTGTYLEQPDLEGDPKDVAPEDPGPDSPGQPTVAAEGESGEPETDVIPDSVIGRFLGKEPEDMKTMLADKAMQDVLTDAFVEQALKMEQDYGDPRLEVVELLAARLDAPAPPVVEDPAPDLEPEVAAEPEPKAPPVATVTLTPKKFVGRNVRAIREQLRDDPALSIEFLEEALAQEQDKKAPRGDVIRKLKARIKSDQGDA